VVEVVVVSPQSGGEGFVAARHAAPFPLFSFLHAFLQVLNPLPLGQALTQALASLAIMLVQALGHVAKAGEATKPASSSSPANATGPAIPRFMMGSVRVGGRLSRKVSLSSEGQPGG
jgi:hypothetical protein